MSQPRSLSFVPASQGRPELVRRNPSQARGNWVKTSWYFTILLLLWPMQSWLQESISEWHDIRTWNPVKHHIAPHDWQLRVGTIHQIAPNLLKAPQNNRPAIMELQLGQQSRWALASAGRLRHPWSLPTHPGLLSHCAHGYTWMQVASNGCTKQNRWKCVLLTMPNTAASCQCPNRACG